MNVHKNNQIIKLYNTNVFVSLWGMNFRLKIRKHNLSFDKTVVFSPSNMCFNTIGRLIIFDIFFVCT